MHAIYTSSKIIRYANCLRNKLNKKLINLLFFVWNESFVFFNLDARSKWTHSKLKNTDDLTIEKNLDHELSDVVF
jgi:hypothetical protein